MTRILSISVILFYFFSLLGCNNENELPNFSDDAILRLKSISWYRSSNSNQIFNISFNYDSAGRLINTQSNFIGSSTADLNYDDEGRLIQVGDYEYFYNTDNKIIKIENENLRVASGTYDGTVIEYSDGKITSMTESFTGDTQKRINTTNISYNNRDQINSLSRTIKDVNLDSNQEFIIQLDKESYSYDQIGNIAEIIKEYDYDSGDTPVFDINYAFDSYRNPAQLVLKTTNISDNNSVIFLRAISEKNYFNVGSLFNYFMNNMVSYSQIPQTNDDDYWDLRFAVDFEYNEYGYPVSAVETQTSINGNFEILTFFNWEYEEFPLPNN